MPETFNLEEAIADWRRQMLAAGIKFPVPLEELEIHLREEIERQMRLGHDGVRAVEIASSEIGRPDLVRNEFKKNERKLMRRNLVILLGILAIAFGPAVFLPALAQHLQEGIWNSGIVTPLVVGVVITLIGFGVAIRGFRLRKV
jgi:hypothetical protein